MRTVCCDPTPWGNAEHVTAMGYGIRSVSTASHGGIFVPDRLLHAIPERMRLWAKRWSGSEQWYEEDCCWAAVAHGFPDLFTDEERAFAARLIESYCPVV